MPQTSFAQHAPATRTLPPNPTDAELVERVREGSAAAFELIMRRYNRRLYRLARSVVKNASEAEDVVQETYVRAYVKLGDFAGSGSFSAWLARIAVNEALGRLRRQGKVVSLEERSYGGIGEDIEEPIEMLQSDLPDPERLAANEELRGLLESAIDNLPDDFRTVFVMRAVEGMSVAECAQCLSIRPETVKTRFHRARRLLQTALTDSFAALTPSLFRFGGERCDRIVASVLARLSLLTGASSSRSSTESSIKNST